MSQVNLSLLGNPQLHLDGELIALDRHKAFALLAYLAVTGQSSRRDTLATLLWSDFDQTRARAALRRALASLNKAIPGAWWETDRETIGLNLKTSSHFLLDIAQFYTRLKDCQKHGHPAAEVCPLCLAPLTEAVTLYRGDFLSGFTLRNSPTFDDWQFNQTEILRRDLSSALERLARLHASQGNFNSAINHSRRWLSLDPLNESAHRQLMLLHAQAGQRHAALRQYAECVRALERDVGVAPQDETTQLYEAIKADAPQPIPASTPQTDAAPQATPHTQSQASSSQFERLVRGAILSRIQRLPQEVQELLKLAAIHGREFEAGILPGFGGSGQTSVLKALEQAQCAQLIIKSERAGRFAFTHALVPFALHESLSGLRRQRLHARAAEAIELQRPDDIEALAYHFAAAGMRAKAVEYSRRSAARAEGLYAYDSAIRHLQTALEMLEAREDVHLHIALLEDLADLHFKINEGVRAIPIYLEALQLWRGLSNADRWIAVRLQRKIGEAAVYLNRFADHQRFAATARSCLEAGLALVEHQPPHPETIRLLCALSRDAWYVTASADWYAAEKYAQAALAMAELLGKPEELSLALEVLYFVYGARGMFRERVEVCRQRLDLSRGPGFTGYRERVDILYLQGRALYSLGEFESALSYAMETENLSAAVQDVSSQVTSMVLQSQCLFSLDRWDDLFSLDARLAGIQARNPVERMGPSLWAHTSLVSVLERYRGNRDKAEALRKETYNTMIAIAGPPEDWVRNHHLVYCRLLMSEGEFALVLEHGERALTLGSRGWVIIGDHDLYNLLADAAAQRYDEASLRKYAPLAEESAFRYDHKLYQAIAHRTWGVLHRLAGQYTESQIRFDRALEIFQQMNTRWQVGRTLLEMGELALERSNITMAHGHYVRALEALESVQAIPEITRICAAIEKL